MKNTPTLLILAILFVATTLTHAAEKKAHAVKGKLAELDDTTIIVEKKGGDKKPFTTDDDTEYEVNGEKGTFDDLKQDMYILVFNKQKSSLALKVYASATDKRVGPARKQKDDKDNKPEGNAKK